MRVKKDNIELCASGLESSPMITRVTEKIRVACVGDAGQQCHPQNNQHNTRPKSEDNTNSNGDKLLLRAHQDDTLTLDFPRVRRSGRPGGDNFFQHWERASLGEDH